MKTNINFSVFLLLIFFVSSCKKENPYRQGGYQPGSGTNSTTPVRKDTCTHGRQYYLNFKIDSTPISCNSNLWTGSDFGFDMQVYGRFPNGYIYLIVSYALNYIPGEFPINFWNSIELNLNDQTYYAGREYDDIIGSGTIRIQGITDECVKGSFECITGISIYYGTSTIKNIKDGLFHIKKS